MLHHPKVLFTLIVHVFSLHLLASFPDRPVAPFPTAPGLSPSINPSSLLFHWCSFFIGIVRSRDLTPPPLQVFFTLTFTLTLTFIFHMSCLHSFASPVRLASGSSPSSSRLVALYLLSPNHLSLAIVLHWHRSQP